MANPAPYIVSYNFGGFQSNNPTTPLPGSALDSELDSVASAIATIISAVEDIRRSDGALNNGIVTFDSLEAGLQFLIDPTNGQLVAAAVAAAQAAAVLTAADRVATAASAASALTQAIAAANSAATVNLSLYLAKSNNLAGLGSQSTSRSNLGLGSVATFDVGGAANNIVQLDGSGKVPAYDGSQLTNVDVLPVGTLVWVTGVSALPGTVKANGALVSRTAFPRLWEYANDRSGNIITEAVWMATNSGSYSNGDLATTFRLIDARAQFIRAYDDGRGLDVRNFGQVQADSLKDHVHAYTDSSGGQHGGSGVSGGVFSGANNNNTGSASIGGAETRPRNITLLACIKF